LIDIVGFKKRKTLRVQALRLIGGGKKEFPRFRSLLEPQFPLGNTLFPAAVRASKCNFDTMEKMIVLDYASI
jgi:hypothetical protein